MTTINDELRHFGVQGMKWGVRNYQNPDGSLTPAGRVHYGIRETDSTGKAYTRGDQIHNNLQRRSAQIGAQKAKAKENLQKVKAKYELGEATKADKKTAKNEYKSARNKALMDIYSSYRFYDRDKDRMIKDISDGKSKAASVGKAFVMTDLKNLGGIALVTAATGGTFTYAPAIAGAHRVIDTVRAQKLGSTGHPNSIPGEDYKKRK